MPPKRKAAAAKGAGGKKAKKAAAADEPEAGTSTMSDAIQKLKAADKGKKKAAKVDALCPYSSTATVHEDYDCMLNQTNIGHNNNKYYIIQVLKHNNGQYYHWNRWGRVGESGANALHGPSNADTAINAFKKKFKDKTKNNWDNRSNFTPAAGKYTMLDMDDEEEDAAAAEEKNAKLDALDGVLSVTAKCTLDTQTQGLVKLLFDNDMFRDAMKDLEIDVKKMPLGKLSKTQIAKGFEALEEIESAIKDKKKGSTLDQLSSKFYTHIPHDFGRARPPIITTDEQLRKKMDMLMVLADIEIAQAMQKTKTPSMTKSSKEVPHPLDANYERLQADLDLLDKKGDEFKTLAKYLNETKSGGWRNPQILDIWKVNRHHEQDRFLAHDAITNRRLLWHGTNVAVVAAILKSGLRIMPHSGGRVGKGIYFASENSKSAGYVSCASGGIGIMFLNEVALGREHHIMVGDGRLTAAPKGYDSIVAVGHTEPDRNKDTFMTFDGKKVAVPQGKAVQQPANAASHFSQSEYLIYKESQNRIRYLLKLKM